MPEWQVNSQFGDKTYSARYRPGAESETDGFDSCSVAVMIGMANYPSLATVYSAPGLLGKPIIFEISISICSLPCVWRKTLELTNISVCMGKA